MPVKNNKVIQHSSISDMDDPLENVMFNMNDCICRNDIVRNTMVINVIPGGIQITVWLVFNILRNVF